MGFEQLIIAAQDWGPTAISVIIAFVISYILKQQAKNSEDDKKRAEEFKKSLSAGLTRIEENANRNDSELKKEIEKQRTEIEALKLDKLDKNDFYKDMGGWRKEINRLQDIIINQNNSTVQKIIELWKEHK